MDIRPVSKRTCSYIFTFLIQVLGVGSSVPKGVNLRMQDTLFKELILTVNRGCLTVE